MRQFLKFAILFNLFLLTIVFGMNCESPIIRAAKLGGLNDVKSEIERGRDVNEDDSEGNTVLMIAAEKDQLEMVKYLINQGANPTLKNDLGQTALDIAIENNHQAIADYLKSLDQTAPTDDNLAEQSGDAEDKNSTNVSQPPQPGRIDSSNSEEEERIGIEAEEMDDLDVESISRDKDITE